MVCKVIVAKWEECAATMARRTVEAMEDITPNNPNEADMEDTFRNSSHNLDLHVEEEIEAAAQGMREAKINIVAGEDLMVPLAEVLLALCD